MNSIGSNLNKIRGTILKLDNKTLENKINEIIKIVDEHDKPNIINSGLLKAGKSSLFNAIYGEDEFKSDVIRATIENKKVSLEKYNLVDTPGLDANDEDSEVAFNGYKDADILVFVHNSIDGELNKIEIDAIQKIIDICNDKDVFFSSSIMVISHVDQLESEQVEENLLNTINNQCKKIFNDEFAYTIGVSSTGYIKGVKENKQLLKKHSNIDTLKDILEELIDEGKSCFNSSLKNTLEQIKSDILEELNKLKSIEKNTKSHNVNLEKEVERAKNIINSTCKSTLSSISKGIPTVSIAKPYFGERRSYSTYSSQYKAESAAKEACEAAIKTAGSHAKSEGLRILNYLENYSTPDGGLKDARTQVLKSYNDMKKIYYGLVEGSDTMTLNIEYKELSLDSNLNDKRRIAKNVMQYISRDCFRSPNYYLTNYSCNMDIDYDYTEEYVSGLFGNKWKEVKVYNWEIGGAIDDIESDYEEILGDRFNEVIDVYDEIYKMYLDDMKSQYRSQVNVLKDSFDKKTKILIQENEKIRKQQAKNKENISNLMSIIKEIDNIVL